MSMPRMIAIPISLTVLAFGVGQPAEAQTQPQTQPGAILLAKKDCGGVNQSSCWSINPKKWCNPGLTYLPGGAPGKGRCIRKEAKASGNSGSGSSNCGGLNQSSCWALNPQKWCESGLTYMPGGVPGKGRCIRKPAGIAGPGSTDCGGLNQSSCWALNPKKWCNGNLKYVPGGLPGKGRCRDPRQLQMMDTALKLGAHFVRLGRDNPLRQLFRCLNQRENKAAMATAIRSRSKNAANSVIRGCNVDPGAMLRLGQNLKQHSMGSSNQTMGSSNQDDSPPEGSFVFFEFAGGAGAGFFDSGGTIGGSIGYAVPLTERAKGSRFYGSSEKLMFGGSLNVGADLVAGLSWVGIADGDWADDPGYAVNVSGALGIKGGLSVGFEDTFEATSISLSIGGGVGGEVGFYESNTKYLVDR